MNVPLWLLIPGVPLAFVGFIVVTFIVWMAADEIRLARLRQNRPTSDRPTLSVIGGIEYDADAVREHPLGAVVEDPARRRR